MKVVVDAIAHPQVDSEKFSNMDHYIHKHIVINSKTTAGVGGGGGGWVGGQIEPKSPSRFRVKIAYIFRNFGTKSCFMVA